MPANPLTGAMPAQGAAPDPLADLRGLHLPEATGAWPPSPIWWLIAGLLIVAALWLAWRWRQHRIANAYRKQAREALQQLQAQDADFASDCQAILRRAALTHYPGQRTEIAPLSGAAWLDFLNAKCPAPVFSDALIDQAAEAHYRPAAIECHHELREAALRWLKEHR